MALVSGGAGFIGSHLVEGLLREGYRVRVLDDFSSGKASNLTAVADAVEVVRGDVSRTEDVRAAMDGVEVVFHEAAVPSVQRSVEDPLGTHRVNLEGTLIMLEEARRAGVGRFVFAGSSSAYGDSEVLPKSEDMAPDPLSPYAAQKLASERYCRVYARCYGLATVALRYFNVYGPRQDPSSPYSGVISLFVTALMRGRAPTIYGDGEQSRDFVYVGDVVRANLAAARRPLTPGVVLNVAGGRRVTINELFLSVRMAVGTRAQSIAPVYLEARTGDVRHSLAALDAARQELEYAPEVPLGEGIRRTVDFYRKETES